MNRKSSSRSTLHRMIVKEKQRLISKLRECGAGVERNEHLDENLNCACENLNCAIEESVPFNEIEGELPNESNTTNSSGENNLREKLRKWYQELNPSRETVESLLKILKSEGLDVPISLKGLLKTQGEKLIIRTVPPGTYFHLALKQEINELKDIIQKQNEFILGESAEIKVIVRQLQREKNTNETLPETRNFPLKSKTSLEQFERDVSNFDEDDVIGAIQKILGKGGLSKQLHNILDKEIILTFNYDGMQGKEAFKVFATVNNIFYKAVEKDVGTRDNYIKELKKGFRLHKNKYHKIKCLGNKKSTE